MQLIKPVAGHGPPFKDMSHTILTDILIIFAVAVPAAFIFYKIKLPPIIGFLVTGVLIGPSGMRLVTDPTRIDLFAEIGVSLLLFSFGLEFSIKHFGAMRKVVFAGGILQISAITACATAVAHLSGYPWAESLFWGYAITMSSTSIVYYILSHKRLVDSPQGRISLGLQIVGDLSVVPIFAILPVVASSSYSSISLLEVAAGLMKALLVFAVFFAGSRYVIPRILHHITMVKSKELFLTTILVIALGMGFFTDRMGLSFVLGTFLGGLMIADTDFRFHALSEIGPFRYCFNGLFFVSIGMLVHSDFLTSHIVWLTVLCMAIITGKAIITALVVILFSYPMGVAVMTGIALSQVGEFSFLIALVARRAGIVSSELYNFTVAAAFITILLTPLLMSWAPHIAGFFDRRFSFYNRRCSKRAADIDSKGMHDHVIICGFGPLGSSVGHILEQVGREYIVLELNPATVRRLKEGNRRVYLGDGASAEILYKSGVERASILAVTAPDYMNSMAIIKQARNMNPGLKIITRAKFRNQVEDLYAAGADIVISEELEAGIEMGRYILLHMGIDESTIEQYSQTIRAFGSADFF